MLHSSHVQSRYNGNVQAMAVFNIKLSCPTSHPANRRLALGQTTFSPKQNTNQHQISPIRSTPVYHVQHAHPTWQSISVARMLCCCHPTHVHTICPGAPHAHTHTHTHTCQLAGAASRIAGVGFADTRSAAGCTAGPVTIGLLCPAGRLTCTKLVRQQHTQSHPECAESSSASG